MNWIIIPLFLATLAWTALSFVAYNDWLFALKGSLPAWGIFAAVWGLLRWSFRGRDKRRSVFKKARIAKRPSLPIAGLTAAIFLGVIVFAFSAGKWLERGNESGKNSLPVAPKTATESLSAEQGRTLAEKGPQGSGQADNTPQTAPDPWSVQVGAFRSEELAAKLATTLKGKGYEAYVIRGENDAVTFYRTTVGRFKTREEAEKLLIELKGKGDYPTAFVVGM